MDLSTAEHEDRRGLQELVLVLTMLLLAVLLLLSTLVPEELLVLLLPLPLLLAMVLLKSQNGSIVHRRGFAWKWLTQLCYSNAYTCEENPVRPCAKYRFLRFEHRSSSPPEGLSPPLLDQCSRSPIAL